MSNHAKLNFLPSFLQAPIYCIDSEFLRVYRQLTVMNVVGKWLMIFWVIAGLGARVMAQDTHWLDPRDSHCCADHHDADPEENSPEQHHESCPPGPHHHHACTCAHSLPLSAEDDWVSRLHVPPFCLLEVSQESETPPEKPFLQLEKPPLI